MSKIDYSPEQRAVFADAKDGKGHTCVESVAGAGKTSSLIGALNYVPTSCRGKVLVTSFGRKCVDELKSKVPYWLDNGCKTLNGLGYGAVIRNMGKLEIDKDNVYNVLDVVVGEPPKNIHFEQKKEFNRVRYLLKKAVDIAKGHLAETPEEIYDLCDEYQISTDVETWMSKPLADKLGQSEEHIFPHIVVEMLERSKAPDGKIDFNDQIWLPNVHDMDLIKCERAFVDEAQDLNPAQFELVKRSLYDRSRVTIIGDSKQALYAFRGAGIGMAPYAQALKAKELHLSVSYRCPKVVVREAQKLVPMIQAHPDAPEGELFTIDSEDLIDSVKPNDMILSRNNAEISRLFTKFLRSSIPVTVVGDSLYHQLKGFVSKANKKTVADLLEYADAWEKSEITKRQDKFPDCNVSNIVDKAEAIRIFADGAKTIADVKGKIERLLDKARGPAVSLSTVHQMKGMENDRVFVLDYTFYSVPGRKWRKNGESFVWSEEAAMNLCAREPSEICVRYVAVTRSKKTLIKVVQELT